MLKTLNKYLWSDIVKATFGSLLVFTIVMTVFAIMEPLRREGLSGPQILSLFVYTVPVMLSLTLPVAALFSTSIIYGRFSQDNELLACRASGISTMSILKPAIALGLAISVFSWILSNYITPSMAEQAEASIKSNVRQIAYRKLKQQKVYMTPEYIIHADRVDEKNDRIQGVVVVDYSKERKLLKKKRTTDVDDLNSVHPTIFAAQTAWAAFDTDEDTNQTFATFDLEYPVLIDGENIRLHTSGAIQSIPIPGGIRKKASIYSWGELIEKLHDPTSEPIINNALKKIRGQLIRDVFTQTVSEELADFKPYRKLVHNDSLYQLRSPKVIKMGAGSIGLESDDKNKVEVTVMRNGTEIQKISADGGILQATISERTREISVSVLLDKNVKIHDILSPDLESYERKEWTQGPFELPQNVAQKSQPLTPKEIYYNVENHTKDRGIIDFVNILRNKFAPDLYKKIVAEMHARVAYSASCTALVMIGAALGLIFKGGQFASAFAISIVPAMIVISMIKSGSRIIQNPNSSISLGLGVIWAGVAIVTVTTVVLYVKLSKQ